MLRAIPTGFLLGVPVAAAVLCAFGVVRAAPPGGRAAPLVWDGGNLGAQACGVCHERQYQDWLRTPHARAFEVLAPPDRTNPRCLVCHATGTAPELQGVQCESCHGPGADYWPDFVMRDKGLARAVGLRPAGAADTCGRCHVPEAPSLRPFKLEDALPRINHSRSKVGAT